MKISDILLIIGSLSVCTGVFMIYIPAAIILSGLFICLFSYSIYKAGK
jgi:hypothetical protein